MTDVFDHNREAWDRQSTSGECRWSQPVDQATIQAARVGDWEVVLTPTLPVPRAWFGDLRDADLLCLASGGGQQAPVFAAAGARVTSFDASPEQLAKDRLVADRDRLRLRTVEGDMADLSCFEDACFGLVFHPVSNVFARDVRPVWRECFRVLRPGGRLLAGFMNPAHFLFDHESIEAGGRLEVRFATPYSDVESHTAQECDRRVARGWPLEFGHTLDAQIGGQVEVGFAVTGFYEDRIDAKLSRLDAYLPSTMATLARKPGASG